jgi:hypothetical protein
MILTCCALLAIAATVVPPAAVDTPDPDLARRIDAVHVGDSLEAAARQLGRVMYVNVLADGRWRVTFLLRSWHKGREQHVATECHFDCAGRVLEKAVAQVSVSRWISREQFGRVREGMSETALLGLLGPPQSQGAYGKGEWELRYSMRPTELVPDAVILARVFLRDHQVSGVAALPESSPDER